MFLSQQVNKSGTKSKSGFSPPCFYCNIFACTAFFRFPNHTLKLKAPDQPQSAGGESILTRDITWLLNHDINVAEWENIPEFPSLLNQD